MKAARFSEFGGPDVLEVVEMAEPHAGPSEVRIAVRAAGVNASDWKKRAGLMDPELPQTLGYEASGIIDEVGVGVTGTEIGMAVFGVGGGGASQAEYTVLSVWAPLPAGMDFVTAAALPVAVETAARALDQLQVGDGSVGAAGEGSALGMSVFINGASGSVGSAAVQLAVRRGAEVIGSASPRNHERLRELGAHPVAYGDDMMRRVRELAPQGVDRALDVAGNGVLPQLVELAGGAAHVITVADFAGAAQTGVRFSRGDDGRTAYSLGSVARLVAASQFSLPIGLVAPLEQIADVHRAGEAGRVQGKIVLTVGHF